MTMATEELQRLVDEFKGDPGITIQLAREVISLRSERDALREFEEFAFRVIFQVLNCEDVDPNDLAAALCYLSEDKRAALDATSAKGEGA